MIDLHNDFLTEIVGIKNQVEYAKKISDILTFLYCPIWTSKLKNAKKYIKNKQNLIKNYQNLQICIEDIGFLQPNDFNFLNIVNPKYVGLVWNNSNIYGGGAYDISGITKNGKNLVKFLETNNMLVDIAHCNSKTFYDIINVVTRPVFCSHTGFCGIKNDKRNLTNKQLELIVNSNGLVGLYFVGKYICNKKYATSKDVVNNIDYFVQKFGTKHLAIGTDFYGTDDLPYDVRNYEQIDLIEKELFLRGYTKANVEDIFENNAKNFLLK